MTDRDDVPAPRPGGAKYLTEPRSPDPAPVDEVIAAVFARYGGSAAVAAARLIEQWPEVAGAEWGAKARAVAVSDGTLVVEVAGGADATLLRYDEGAIRARIQARFGPDLVRSIRVRVGGPRGRR